MWLGATNMHEMFIETLNPTEQLFIGRVTVDDIILLNERTMRLKTPGGGVMYSAAAAALWGDRSGIIGRYGDSYNDKSLLKLTRHQNLDTTGLSKKEGNGIKFWILYDEEGGRDIFLKRDSSQFSSFDPTPSDISEKYIEEGRLFHIAPFALEAQMPIVETLYQRGKIITLDPDDDSCLRHNNGKWNEMMSKIDVFMPSAMEFQKLSGESVHSNESLKKLREFAITHNIKFTILKLGVNGVLLFDLLQDKYTKYPAASCNAVSCTGTGDSFAGGFCHMYKKSLNPYESIPYGLVSAAMKAEGFGSDYLLTKTCEEAKARLSEYLMTYSDILGDSISCYGI